MSSPPDAVHPVARLPEEWRAWAAARGERRHVADQIFSWIQRRGVLDPARMTNLSAKTRGALEAEGLRPVLDLRTDHASADGSRKLVLGVGGGATIESVLLPRTPADADDDEPEERGEIPVTQCISTQVGCAMGCTFCASGVAGLKRNLGPEEIVAQVLLGRAELREGEALRNVVYMGMGEPLHNYEATARSLRLLFDEAGLGLSTRRVTVSTSGLVPEIRRLGEEFDGKVALAVSLHAPDDASRSALMPINRRYPLAELMAALRAYPLPPRRRITIEYTLVAGRNDGDAEARALVGLLRGIPVKVNLIPMNPIDASPLGPSDGARVAAFQRILTDAGLSCFVRRRRGDDVAAACGQLALRGAAPKVRGFRAAGGEPSRS